MKPAGLILLLALYFGGAYVLLPYLKEKLGGETGVENTKLRLAVMFWPVIVPLVWLDMY